MTTKKVGRLIERGPTSPKFNIKFEVHRSEGKPTIVVSIDGDTRPPTSLSAELTEEIWRDVVEDEDGPGFRATLVEWHFTLLNMLIALKTEIPPGPGRADADRWSNWLGIGQRVQAGANEGGHKKAISIRKRNQKWRDMAEDLYRLRPSLSVCRVADILADRVKANPHTVRKVISKKRPGPGLE